MKNLQLPLSGKPSVQRFAGYHLKALSKLVYCPSKYIIYSYQLINGQKLSV
jgi:hypothetical protein